MKLWLYLLLCILCIPIVFSITTCTKETIIPCEVMSPYLVCDAYTYNVTDANGTNYQSGDLTSLGSGLYSFVLENVTINKVYTAKMCTNQTTQITVIPIESEDVGKGSIFLGLILSQFLILIMFAYLSSVLGQGETDTDNYGKKHQKFTILRVLLVFISFVWIFQIYNALAVIIENYIGLSHLIEIAGISAFGWIFYTFVTVYLFVSIFYILGIIRTNKVNELYY